jgi:hypothetical protein
MTARGATRRTCHLRGRRGSRVPLAFVPVDGRPLGSTQRTRLTLLFHPGRVKRGVAPRRAHRPARCRAGGEYRIVVDGEITDVRGTAMGGAHEQRLPRCGADRALATSGRMLRVTAPSLARGRGGSRSPEPLDHALVQRWVWVRTTAATRVRRGRARLSAARTRGRSSRRTRRGLRGRYAVRPAARSSRTAPGIRFDRLFDRDVGPTGRRPADASADVLSLPFDVPPHSDRASNSDRSAVHRIERATRSRGHEAGQGGGRPGAARPRPRTSHDRTRAIAEEEPRHEARGQSRP